MAIERTVYTVAELLADQAARTALWRQAATLMERTKAALPTNLVGPVDSLSATTMELIHSEPSKAASHLLDYFATPTTRPLLKSMFHAPAESMTPRAFKVIRTDGYSPHYGPLGQRWSLPTFEGGQWKPGKPLDVSHTAVGQNGLFVTDKPDQWYRYYNKPGRAPLQIFEAQILDPVGRELWMHPLHNGQRANFAAKTVRLLRPVE